MKKHLLVGLTIGFGSFAVAQTSTTATPAAVKPQKSTVATKAAIYKPGQQAGAEATPSFSTIVNSLRPPVSQTAKAYTNTVIGSTGYQLQTNSSICNRLIKSADGTLSASWTYSAQQTGWTDRGTGYNYFDGTSWGPAPTAKLENVRTGFTNVAVLGNGGEVVVSHEASDIHISQRPVKGTGAWSNAALGYPDVWARMCAGGTDGNTIHVISQTKGTANPPFDGQDAAVAYSRSTDGGVTWDINHVQIPEIDENSYFGFGGDSYAIDARGNTVVIVLGGFSVDVVMIKSTDNGSTWTKTVINQFPIPLFDESQTLSDITGDGVADTIPTNDASVAVLLDNSDKAHVWYGAMRMLNDDLGDAGVSYFPGTDGLMYWNENMGSAAPVMIAAAQDIDGDGVLNVTDFGTYQTSLTSMPSAGIDAAGTIYLSYGSVYEGNAENGAPGDGRSYRHTYVTSSPDGGLTWCEPQDVTDPIGPDQQDYIEGVYGAMAKDVDGFVHLIIQKDGSVGHGVSTTTTDEVQTGSADIVYVKIPVGDVSCLSTGVNEATAASSFGLYPNPASDVANMTFTVASKGNVVIRVFNVTGQMVDQLANQDFAAGTFNMNVDLSKYKAGMYMVNMTTADGTTTQKLIVK